MGESREGIAHVGKFLCLNSLAKDLDVAHGGVATKILRARPRTLRGVARSSRRALFASPSASLTDRSHTMLLGLGRQKFGPSQYARCDEGVIFDPASTV